MKTYQKFKKYICESVSIDICFCISAYAVLVNFYENFKIFMIFFC